MKYLFNIIVIAGAVTYTACTPKPLDINVTQAPPKMVIANTVMDNNTLLLMATYSINSLNNLNDTSGGASPSGIGGMLIKNAMVVLRSDTRSDTLQKQTDGIYSSDHLGLIPYANYTLWVKDLDNGREIVASSAYSPAPEIMEIKPVITRTAEDTIVKIHIVMDNSPAYTGFFVMTYGTLNPKSASTLPGNAKFPVASVDAIKTLELFTGSDAINGTISIDFILNDIASDDTLFVQIGQIEKRYYEYLSAYKRTGSLFNQLTGEPITLPTNVLPGLGYFSLYEARRNIFFLKDF